MTSLTTEDFPYTIGYVLELLGLDERELMTYVQVLGLAPNKDEKTGRMIFTHRDIETLKKAQDLRRHGEDLNAIARQLGGKSAATRPGSGSPINSSEEGASSYLTQPGAASFRPASLGKDNITMMVEAVSQVKEGILKDLSRLLDDKLAGLDEVVVELIRCKSENDSLKKKLADTQHAKETLEFELSRFKPVQFGFYRKS